MANDAAGIFINPAAVTSVRGLQLISLYCQPENNLSSTLFGAVFPNCFRGTIGLGYRNRTVSGVRLTTLEAVDNTIQDILVFYARQLRDDLSLAADVRFIATGFSKDISGFEAAYGSGSTLDLSLKYSPRPWLGAGVSLQNLGGGISYRDNSQEKVSSNSTAGISLKLRPDFLFNLDLSQSEDEPQVLFHGGAEWQPASYFALRLGIDQSPDPSSAGQNYSHITAGFGLTLRGLTFDYTLYKQGDPTQTQTYYFSLGYAGPEEIKVEKKPELPPLPTPEAVIQRREVIKRVHFKDVAEDYWAKEEIELLATAKLISGFPDGTFRPKMKLTREYFAFLLAAAKNLAFTPLPHPNQPMSRLEAARALEINTEVSRPHDTLTRAEFVAFLSQTSFGQAAIRRLPSPLF